MRIGMPGSPARWLSENIQTIPDDHDYALMGMVKGQAVLVVSGTKKLCKETMTDATSQVICDLEKYRQTE